MNARTGIFILAAIVATASAVDQIDVAREASFSDATEFVQSWIAEGKDETACEKVANTAIKAIEDECKTLQIDIDDRAKDNTHCCSSGLTGISKAKADHEKSVKTHSACTEELQTVTHEKVDFGKISYAQLDENQCKATFFNSPSFVAQHKKVTDKKTTCTKLDGETAGLKKAIGDATEAACNERQTCEETAAQARDKTFNDAHAACSSQQNKDAFTRAHHMLCVLKGTSLQGCNVPTFQGVKKTAMNKNSCEVDVGTCNEPKTIHPHDVNGCTKNNKAPSIFAGQGSCHSSYDYQQVANFWCKRAGMKKATSWSKFTGSHELCYISDSANYQKWHNMEADKVKVTISSYGCGSGGSQCKCFKSVVG